MSPRITPGALGIREHPFMNCTSALAWLRRSEVSKSLPFASRSGPPPSCSDKQRRSAERQPHPSLGQVAGERDASGVNNGTESLRYVTSCTTFPSALRPWARYCPIFSNSGMSEHRYSTASPFPRLMWRRHRKFGTTKMSFASQSKLLPLISVVPAPSSTM
jgi:hypothetical protein